MFLVEDRIVNVRMVIDFSKLAYCNSIFISQSKAIVISKLSLAFFSCSPLVFRFFNPCFVGTIFLYLKNILEVPTATADLLEIPELSEDK